MNQIKIETSKISPANWVEFVGRTVLYGCSDGEQYDIYDHEGDYNSATETFPYAIARKVPASERVKHQCLFGWIYI